MNKGAKCQIIPNSRKKFKKFKKSQASNKIKNYKY